MNLSLFRTWASILWTHWNYRSSIYYQMEMILTKLPILIMSLPHSSSNTLHACSNGTLLHHEGSRVRSLKITRKSCFWMTKCNHLCLTWPLIWSYPLLWWWCRDPNTSCGTDMQDVHYSFAFDFVKSYRYICYRLSTLLSARSCFLLSDPDPLSTWTLPALPVCYHSHHVFMAHHQRCYTFDKHVVWRVSIRIWSVWCTKGHGALAADN